MSRPSVQNSPNVSVPTMPPMDNTDPQMKELLAPNAYQNVAGLLVGVLAKLSSEEMKLRQANAEGRVAAAGAQAEAAEAQGTAAEDSSTAEAVGEGVGAVNGIGTTAYGVRGMQQIKAVHEEKTVAVDAKTAQINQLHSPTGMGDRTGIPEGAPREEKIRALEHGRSEAVNKRETAVTERRGHLDLMSGIKDTFAGISKVGTSIATGQTQAASAAAQNAKELAQQVNSDLQNNEKSNGDVAAQALNEMANIGKINEAIVRG
jgi:hypothetical protein